MTKTEQTTAFARDPKYIKPITLERPTSVRVCSATIGGDYDGKELRPFEGRPGAMDAFSLPSRGF